MASRRIRLLGDSALRVRAQPVLDPLSPATRLVADDLRDKEAAFNKSEQEQLWQLAHRLGDYGHVILAGGLTPGNVGQAIKIARPYAVDVSRGVEAEPGEKDHDKLRAFLIAAKGMETNRRGSFLGSKRDG